MKVTISDLAAELGVAPSTISRALRRESGVSADLAAKVATLATKRGYVLPKRLRQAFKTKQEKVVCIAFAANTLVDSFLSSGDLFYWRIFTELQKAAASQGTHVTFVQIDDNMMANGNLHVIEEGIADAIIAHTNQEDIVLNLANRVPLVLINNEFTERPIDCVVTNFASSISMQLKHLRDLGHKKVTVFRPCCIDDHHKPVRMWADRKFLSWLPTEASRLGIAVSEHSFAQWAFLPSEETSCINSFTDALVRESVRPTAILTYDLYAPHLMDALTRHGLKVPHDISIIGADDDTHGRACPIPLTTVSWNFPALAREAINLMLERIKQPNGERKTIKIAPSLIVRSSTASAKTTQSSSQADRYFSQALETNMP